MTVKELKQYIERLPDDAEILIEHAGSDAIEIARIDGFYIADDDSFITLVQNWEDE